MGLGQVTGNHYCDMPNRTSETELQSVQMQSVSGTQWPANKQSPSHGKAPFSQSSTQEVRERGAVIRQ